MVGEAIIQILETIFKNKHASILLIRLLLLQQRPDLCISCDLNLADSCKFAGKFNFLVVGMPFL